MESNMNAQNELRDRILAKKKKLEAQLYELKADSSEAARQTAEQVEENLSKLKEYIKHGFDNLSEEAITKINSWLSRH